MLKQHKTPNLTDEPQKDHFQIVFKTFITLKLLSLTEGKAIFCI